MSGLAGLAVEKGHKVTGQDKAYYPPMSLQLNKIGISENITEKVTEDLKNCDAVIIGNSLSRGNDSVEYTLQNKKKYFSGPEWIRKYILDDKIVFVVTGTHGKTTTTSMLIKIFQDNNLKPSYLLGGIYEEEKISYKYTNSKYFIIEGDEYDTSFFDKRSKFIHYKPHTLIINNIEFDHSDIFENIYEIKKQFHCLLRTMSKKTNIIFKKNDKNIEDVLAMGCWSNKKSFNKINKVKNIVGDHNLENCAAAMIAAETIGISKEASLSALEDFKGVKRRLELVCNKNFILYDDFAHHPTAIKATILALRQKYPGKKINAYFEIRSNSMIAGTHKDSFLDAFKEADNLFIYCSKNIKWIEKFKNVKIYCDIDAIANDILLSTENVDIVILMSNGDTTNIINKLTK
jgi:UDP-N-acetylmuramate: L-alanyl-gamma-D-glutamyl-meso-diaminopimelate ligase